ncbi:MAG: PDZ domain-containing protein, partial [Paludibacteraceae bacterium]|nr:PDZ domain-containing protein [Paludibacteraceae bacterium]
MNNSIWRKLVAAALCVATAVSAYSATNETIKQLKKFYEAKARVSGMYVDAVSDSALIDYAISGMLQKLDPHSVYIPKSEMQQMNEPLVGEFEGIGVQFVMLKDTLYVDAVIPGGPAEKVGVLAGDRFIKANDTLIAGVKMTSRDIMKRLRGKKGTTATVTVVRRGVKDPFEFKIIRDKIPLHSVQAAYMVSPTVGYIKLTVFSDNTKKEFDEALKTLKKAGMKDLIFDLQGNGGGYLKVASSIADEFLDGKQMIVYTKGRAVRETYKSSPGGSFVDGRIVFLVDESSAS